MSGEYCCAHCENKTDCMDKYCRNCGVRFSPAELAEIESNSAASGGLSWFTKDVYRCIKCERFIAVEDGYCRFCGSQIDEHSRQKMISAFKASTSRNIPALIVAALFVLLVIIAALSMVS